MSNDKDDDGGKILQHPIYNAAGQLALTMFQFWQHPQRSGSRDPEVVWNETACKVSDLKVLGIESKVPLDRVLHIAKPIFMKHVRAALKKRNEG